MNLDNVVGHGINVCTLELCNILEEIDAKCFEKAPMSATEWESLNNTNFMACWYTVEDKPIAAAVILICAAAEIAYLYSNGVIEEYRRLGLGKRLLRERLLYLGHTCKKVQTHTRISNIASINLLKSHNFKAIEYVIDCYDDHEDGILWELRTD